MKRIFITLLIILSISACEAGKVTPQRERLHNMGKENICRENPQRCIKGTNIDW